MLTDSEVVTGIVTLFVFTVEYPITSFVPFSSVITVKLSVSDKAPLPEINLLIKFGVTSIFS